MPLLAQREFEIQANLIERLRHLFRRVLERSAVAAVEEAADAVLDFKPKQVYPYHYRGQNGLSDINKFKELVNAGNQDIEVILANWYPTQ